MVISIALSELKAKGELKDFIEFGRKQAKEDGMDDGVFKFFDELEKECEDEEEDSINWIKLIEILKETTNREVMGFKGDKTVSIENDEMNSTEVFKFRFEPIAPLNLEKMNKALEEIGVKLEFIEAMNLPFDIDSMQNFCRFKVIPL